MGTVDKINQVEKGFDLSQAIAEANRCLLCYDPPCSSGCPANTDPGLFIRKLRMKNVTGAIRTIMTNNPLGGTCAYICPTCDLCEQKCSATDLDRPIQIGKIQRFLIEHSHDIGFDIFEKSDFTKGKIAVIGSGPSGLSCAAELAQNGFEVTIFEEKEEPGGALRYALPGYRLKKEMLDYEIEVIKNLGVEIKCSTPIKEKEEVTELLNKGYKAVFIGLGLWEPEKLNEASEEIDGLYSSIEFLKQARSEKTPQVQNKNVVVIGGGDVAMDCAETAIKLGAKDVYVAYRRSFNQMPGSADERMNTLNSGAHFLILNQAKDYIKNEKGNLSAVKLIRTKLGETDSSGRARPVEIENSEWLLSADIVIEAIGVKAAKSSPQWYSKLNMSKKNNIIVDPETMETSMKNIFAGGDIVRGASLVSWAVKDGKLAANRIIRHLSRKDEE